MTSLSTRRRRCIQRFTSVLFLSIVVVLPGVLSFSIMPQRITKSTLGDTQGKLSWLTPPLSRVKPLYVSSSSSSSSSSLQQSSSESTKPTSTSDSGSSGRTGTVATAAAVATVSEDENNHVKDDHLPVVQAEHGNFQFFMTQQQQLATTAAIPQFLPQWLLPKDKDGVSTLNTQTILNAILLISCFGYAMYTIFNIDHGMTRGWTQSEIAMRIPLDNWASYESSLDERPVFTKTLINVIIYLLGDWLSQTLFQSKHVLDFDASRTMKNGFIGLCFGPLVHEYYQFSDTILPVETGGMITRLEKILMDQTIYLTVKCSVYIAAVGFLNGNSWDTVKENVTTRIGGIVVTAWKFWPLVHCITYSVIPAQHRILWVNSVDLIWNAILASMSNNKTNGDDDDIENVALEGHAAPSSSAAVVVINEKSIQDVKIDDSAITEDIFGLEVDEDHHDTTRALLDKAAATAKGENDSTTAISEDPGDSTLSIPMLEDDDSKSVMSLTAFGGNSTATSTPALL